jgi:hypothetical protein
VVAEPPAVVEPPQPEARLFNGSGVTLPTDDASGGLRLDRL